jgi:putative effector of murein hydrolase
LQPALQPTASERPRAFQFNEIAGVFAGIGMGLNALATAILAPLIIGWLW